MKPTSSPSPSGSGGVTRRLDPAIRHFGTFLHHVGGGLRRRGVWIIFGLIGGLIGGAVIAAVTKPPVRTVHYYKATTLMSVATTAQPIGDADALSWTFQIAQIALASPTLQAKVGDELHVSDGVVSNHLQGIPDYQSQTFAITAVTNSELLATNLSITAAQNLNDEMKRQVTKVYKTAEAAASRQLHLTNQRQAEVAQQLQAQPDPVGSLDAQLNAINVHSTRLYTEVAVLKQPPQQALFVITQGPRPIEINANAYYRRWAGGYAGQAGLTASALLNAHQYAPNVTTLSGVKSNVTTAENDLPAPPPISPVKTAALGALAGLVMGIAAVTLGEAWDERLHDAESAALTSGTPVLAEIPHLRMRAVRDLVAGRAHQGAARARARYAEATTILIRDLGLHRDVPGANPLSTRTSVDAPSPHAPVLMITSANPSEGKSTSVAALAASFSSHGFRVLAVDGDAHRTSLRKLLRPIPDLVNQDHPQVTQLERVRLLGTSRDQSSPSLANIELLRMITKWRSEFDIVILDTPPILATNDAADLINHADGVVLVARADQTRGPALERASNQVRRFHTTPLGVIFTDVEKRLVDSTYGDTSHYLE